MDVSSNLYQARTLADSPADSIFASRKLRIVGSSALCSTI